MANKTLSTGLITADTAVFNGKTFLNGILAGGDGTNVATITAYDNTAGSGKVVCKVIVPANQRQVQVLFNAAVQCPNGLYVTVSGTGAEAIVYHGGG